MSAPAVHDGSTGRPVLGRALSVLDTFSDERPEQTLGAIVRDTGSPSERLMARPEAHVRSRVARRLPLHATGPGKILLAHAPDDVVAAVSVVVPADRPDLVALVPAVRVAAVGISRGPRPRRHPA